MKWFENVWASRSVSLEESIKITNTPEGLISFDRAFTVIIKCEAIYLNVTINPGRIVQQSTIVYQLLWKHLSVVFSKISGRE